LLDAAGVGFSDLNGNWVNLFFGGASYFVLTGDNTFFEGTFTVVPTPAPAALPLMGTILGAGYLISKWRRQRSATVAAA